MFSHINRPLQHHHLFIMVIAVAGMIFAGNLLALRQIHNSVSLSSDPQPAPIILTRYAEDETEVEPEENKLAPLAEQLIEILSDHDTAFSVGVKDLSSDDYIGINDTTTMKAASLYKLFVGFEVASRIDRAALSWNGTTGYEAEDTTVSECFTLMITVSDNDCGRALRKLIGGNEQPLPSLAEAGFIGTNIMHDYPTTSAADVVHLFDSLYNQTDLKRTTNQKFVDTLLDQQINNRLPQKLPGGTEVAHKTADLEGYSHDGGIVYTQKADYILVIMSGPWSNEYTEAPPALASISELVYDWFLSESS